VRDFLAILLVTVPVYIMLLAAINLVRDYRRP
jgi:hypothetical protein